LPGIAVPPVVSNSHEHAQKSTLLRYVPDLKLGLEVLVAEDGVRVGLGSARMAGEGVSVCK
jgi:hypothetical protein